MSPSQAHRNLRKITVKVFSLFMIKILLGNSNTITRVHPRQLKTNLIEGGKRLSYQAERLKSTII